MDATDIWPTPWVEAMGDAALVRTADPKVFKRGADYAHQGAVMVEAEDPMPEPALRAQVSGGETYSTEVWIEHDAVQGDCDCPQGLSGAFCKHLVATALVWRTRITGQPWVDVSEGKPQDAAELKKQAARVKRASTLADKKKALHAFLNSQPASLLADRLMSLADADQAIARELHSWRQMASLEGNPSDLKPLITEMLSTGRQLVTWDKRGAFLKKARGVLPLLQQAAERDAGSAATLSLHALRRAWVALHQVDDSNGSVGQLCQEIGQCWADALAAGGEQPANFGDTYLRVRLEDPFDSFDAKAVEAAMGEAAISRYRKVLAAAWRQARDEVRQPQTGQRRNSAVYRHASEEELRLGNLERLHLAQLSATGQVDEALAVLRGDLHDAWQHLRLITALETHGRVREAFAQTEQACKAFPDDWRLEEALLRCYERDGWAAEALVLRRRQFERRPDPQAFHAVVAASRAAGQDVAVARHELLASVMAQEMHHEGANRSHAGPAKRVVTLRVEILMSEGLMNEALSLVQTPGMACDVTVLSRLAEQLPAEQNAEAVALLLRVLGGLMPCASTPYQRELTVVAMIAQRLVEPERSRWLVDLRAEHKAKRNFIKGLPS